MFPVESNQTIFLLLASGVLELYKKSFSVFARRSLAKQSPEIIADCDPSPPLGETLSSFWTSPLRGGLSFANSFLDFSQPPC
jgi:hypothetical protein